MHEEALLLGSVDCIYLSLSAVFVGNSGNLGTRATSLDRIAVEHNIGSEVFWACWILGSLSCQAGKLTVLAGIEEDALAI